MPQITVEYTDNLALAVDWKTTTLEMHNIVEDVIRANIADCKSRLIRVHDFVIGADFDIKGFIHVCIAVMPGRSVEQCKAATDAVTALFERALKVNSPSITIQITCEIRQLAGDSYNKRLLGIH